MGNPGRLPTGPATAGLRISEIMFAPESPLVAVGFSENDFEWVEIYNHTAAAIDFTATPYVFDDIAGSALSSANVSTGTLAVDEVGVLFRNGVITADDMAAMWGDTIKFIPVTNWPALNNAGGDTIALWDSLADYTSEPVPGTGRTHDNAVAAQTYDTVAGNGWPTVNNKSSIFLNNLSANPNTGASWTRSGAMGDSLSFAAEAIFQTATDHPGGDVGSPGYAPGTVQTALLGDYNGNHVIDAADYIVWRNHRGTGNLLNDATPGTVDVADYIYWKTHFGTTGGSGGAASVPEPASGVLLLIAALIHPVRRIRKSNRSNAPPVG